MARVKFYLEFRNGRKVKLPVNPEKLEIKCSGNNATEYIVGTGDINILKAPGLKEISFESFIPEEDSDGSYVESGSSIDDGNEFVKFINKIRNANEPVRLVVTGLGPKINWRMGIQSFDYSWSGGDKDMHYTLSLREYKTYGAKVAQLQVTTTPPTSPAPATSAPARENTPKAVSIGCTVIVNGQLHRDSDGQGPGATESNATRKVNFIKNGKPYPYHVTTTSGGWRGWVAASAVEVVS